MALAAFPHAPGSLVAGWRLPDAMDDADMNFQSVVEITKLAEQGKMDCVFFQDSNAMNGSNRLVAGGSKKARAQYARGTQLDPMMMLPALAMCTTHIGLVATATTTYNEPYHVARRFSTIDHISGGRAGWNLVTTQNEDEAGNFGYDKHVEHAIRYERAAEFYDVVVGLWDGWEEGALLRDKASGVYYDLDRLHIIQHEGKFFKVRGPLNVTRCPQGRPIIAQAGSSDPGRELAAKTADLVFTAQDDLKQAQAFYADVKGRARRYGRSPDHIKILPGIVPLVGSTRQEAQDLYDRLQTLITDDLALRALARHTGGVDLSKYPIDGPLPDLPPSNSAKGRQQMLLDMAKTGMSIRQLGVHFASGSGHNALIGTPTSIADQLEEWFLSDAADGYTVIFPYFIKPVHDFVTRVIPELQRRGLLRTEYESTVLRENLGLPYPKNIFRKAAPVADSAAE